MQKKVTALRKKDCDIDLYYVGIDSPDYYLTDVAIQKILNVNDIQLTYLIRDFAPDSYHKELLVFDENNVSRSPQTGVRWYGDFLDMLINWHPHVTETRERKHIILKEILSTGLINTIKDAFNLRNAVEETNYSFLPLEKDATDNVYSVFEYAELSLDIAESQNLPQSFKNTLLSQLEAEISSEIEVIDFLPLENIIEGLNIPYLSEEKSHRLFKYCLNNKAIATRKRQDNVILFATDSVLFETIKDFLDLESLPVSDKN